METVTRIVRTAFLLAVFVAHPRPSLAADLDIVCTPGCAGGGSVRTLDCTFSDNDHNGTSSVCNGAWSCYMGSCCGDVGGSMQEAMWDWCYYESISQGGGYPWFVMGSCDDVNQSGNCQGVSGNYIHASGTFYCSFDIYPVSCS